MTPRALFIEPVDPRLDVKTCRAYGEMVTLFEQGLPVPAAHGRFRQILLDKLDEIDYNVDCDYFVIAGKLSKVAVASAIISDNWPEAKFLVYSESAASYVALSMPAEISVP